MSELAPCRDCRRHVRVGGPCPFCGCAVHEVVGPDLPHRMSRGAAYAFVALAVAGGCKEAPQATPEPAKKVDEATTTKTAEPPASASASVNQPPVAIYGAPPLPLPPSTSVSVAPSTSVSAPRPAPTPTAIPTPAKPAYGGPPKPVLPPMSKPAYGAPPGE